jgi:hypothetical protein
MRHFYSGQHKLLCCLVDSTCTSGSNIARDVTATMLRCMCFFACCCLHSLASTLRQHHVQVKYLDTNVD